MKNGVLATISDRKTGVDDGNGGIDHYIAEVLSQQDYYPFGMQMIGRQYSAGDGYRYGFNGQEKSTEIDANGNSMTAEFWQYDARIGRRWNTDPRPNVSLSPYNTFGGNPIWMCDPYGDTTINGQKMEALNAAAATTLQEVVVTGKKKYVPEQDFMHNKLTTYNSKTGKGYRISNNATVKSLMEQFIQNWNCSDGSCRNTIIVGGELLEGVKNIHSVKQLFIKGVNNLSDQNFKAGSTFTGFYGMSDLNGKDGIKMKKQVLEDLMDGKSFTDSRFFSAEFFLGSYGFSMRITDDGKYTAITVYDAKTISSLTDGNKTLLRELSPINPDTRPTYQRYFWVIPVEKLKERYKETVDDLYKNKE